MPNPQTSKPPTTAHWNSVYLRLRQEASTTPFSKRRQLKEDKANVYRKFYQGREDQRRGIPSARETAESKKEEAQTRYDSIALPTEDDLVNFSEAVMAAESALRAFEQPIREERYKPDWRKDGNPLWLDVENDDDYKRGVAREKEEMSKALLLSNGGKQPVTSIGGSVSQIGGTANTANTASSIGGRADSRQSQYHNLEAPTKAKVMDADGFTLVGRPMTRPGATVPSGEVKRGSGRKGQGDVSGPASGATTQGRGGGWQGSSRGQGGRSTAG